MLARTTSPRPFRQRIIRAKPAPGAPSATRSGVRWRLGIFALALLSACTAGSTPLVKLHGVPAGGFEQQLNQACGKPIAYPISAKCITLMGSAGPMLQHRSDLVMKIWRTCPDDNPCYRITKTDPACAGQTPSAVSDHRAGTNDACLMAQEANYSCAALRDDLVYLDRTQHSSSAKTDNDCAQAKTALAEYDRKIEEVSVRIQWYRIFAEKGF